MNRTIIATLALTLGASALFGQNPAPAPQGVDSPPMWRRQMRQGADPAQVERLRQAVEERWGRMVQAQLQLTDQQMDRVRAATRAHQDRRRDFARQRQDLERATAQQMQPGVAANQDSLNRMLDRMARLRVEEAQSDEQLNRDLGFLTPVQRARFFMMSRRFEERLREIRERRLEGRPMPGMRSPGARPGGGPGPNAPDAPEDVLEDDGTN